jgi:mannonate dehydratase
MHYTWRWYGPKDPVPLDYIAQAGAQGIVTALHHLPNGSVWPEAEIHRRQAEAADAGLPWAVVESLPVPEAVKAGLPGSDAAIEAYVASLRNLGKAGIRTLCYNFMPVLDWTRSDLSWPLPGGARTLRFERAALAAFDCLILRRPGAEADYDAFTLERAERLHQGLNEAQRRALVRTLIAGLPGAEEQYGLDSLRKALEPYQGLPAEAYRERLRRFVAAVAPEAEAAGVRLAIHPDDPPFPILGLPRVVSTAADYEALFSASASPANGITFCTGSLAARPDNDVQALFRLTASRVFFLHLRNITCNAQGDFYESGHLDGDVDMAALIGQVLAEEQRRGEAIPMRPDHGLQMMDDLSRTDFNPGYTAIGRMRGLAELRSIERLLSRFRLFDA